MSELKEKSVAELKGQLPLIADLAERARNLSSRSILRLILLDPACSSGAMKILRTDFILYFIFPYGNFYWMREVPYAGFLGSEEPRWIGQDRCAGFYTPSTVAEITEQPGGQLYLDNGKVRSKVIIHIWLGYNSYRSWLEFIL